MNSMSKTSVRNKKTVGEKYLDGVQRPPRFVGSLALDGPSIP